MITQVKSNPSFFDRRGSGIHLTALRCRLITPPDSFIKGRVFIWLDLLMLDPSQTSVLGFGPLSLTFDPLGSLRPYFTTVLGQEALL